MPQGTLKVPYLVGIFSDKDDFVASNGSRFVG